MRAAVSASIAALGTTSCADISTPAIAFDGALHTAVSASIAALGVTSRADISTPAIASDGALRAAVSALIAALGASSRAAISTSAIAFDDALRAAVSASVAAFGAASRAATSTSAIALDGALCTAVSASIAALGVTPSAATSTSALTVDDTLCTVVSASIAALGATSCAAISTSAIAFDGASCAAVSASIAALGVTPRTATSIFVVTVDGASCTFTSAFIAALGVTSRAATSATTIAVDGALCPTVSISIAALSVTSSAAFSATVIAVDTTTCAAVSTIISAFDSVLSTALSTAVAIFGTASRMAIGTIAAAFGAVLNAAFDTTTVVFGATSNTALSAAATGPGVIPTVTLRASLAALADLGTIVTTSVIFNTASGSTAITLRADLDIFTIALDVTSGATAGAFIDAAFTVTSAALDVTSGPSNFTLGGCGMQRGTSRYVGALALFAAFPLRTLPSRDVAPGPLTLPPQVAPLTSLVRLQTPVLSLPSWIVTPQPLVSLAASHPTLLTTSSVGPAKLTQSFAQLGPPALHCSMLLGSARLLLARAPLALQPASNSLPEPLFSTSTVPLNLPLAPQPWPLLPPQSHGWPMLRTPMYLLNGLALQCAPVPPRIPRPAAGSARHQVNVPLPLGPAVLLGHLGPSGSPVRLGASVPFGLALCLTSMPRQGLWTASAVPTPASSPVPFSSRLLCDSPAALAAPALLGSMPLIATRLPPLGSATMLTLPSQMDEPIPLGSLWLRGQCLRSTLPDPFDSTTCFGSIALLTALQSRVTFSQSEMLPLHALPFPLSSQLLLATLTARPTVYETWAQPLPLLPASLLTPRCLPPLARGWFLCNGFLATHTYNDLSLPGWLFTRAGRPSHHGFPAERTYDGALPPGWLAITHAYVCHSSLTCSVTSGDGALFPVCLVWAVDCSGGAVTSLSSSVTSLSSSIIASFDSSFTTVTLDFDVIYGADQSGGAGTTTNTITTLDRSPDSTCLSLSLRSIVMVNVAATTFMTSSAPPIPWLHAPHPAAVQILQTSPPSSVSSLPPPVTPSGNVVPTLVPTSLPPPVTPSGNAVMPTLVPALMTPSTVRVIFAALLIFIIVCATVTISLPNTAFTTSSNRLLLVTLLMVGPVYAPASTRRTVATSDPTIADIDIGNLIASRQVQVQRLHEAIQSEDTWAAARALYACTDRNVARCSTGHFNQALSPESAVRLAIHISSLAPPVTRILWVGCGHGFEAMLLALNSQRPLSILAIDHVPECITSAHLLLRRVLVATSSLSIFDAANVDLSRPVTIGVSTIIFQLQDAWQLSSTSNFDFMYSAAEQETDGSHQHISLFLQALCGGVAVLAMYSTMWAKCRHRAPTVGDSLRVSLEAGRRTIVACDLREYPMFSQPPQSGTRSTISPPGWTVTAFGSPVLCSLGRRVAVYFPDDDLWYPSTATSVGSARVVLRFDDSHWPDVVIDELESPPLLALLSPSEGEYVAADAVIGSPVDPPAAPRRTSRSAVPPNRYVPCVPPAQPQCGLTAPSVTSSDGLWLSSSESGYVGVYRDLRDPSSRQLLWRARIYCSGSWRQLGNFASPRAAAVAYAAARDDLQASRASHVVEPPSHCIHRVPRATAESWAARTYKFGRYHHIGVFATRAEAVDAYRATMTASVADSQPQRPLAVATEYLGVRLHLSASSSTGYVNVQPRGRRFRAVTQSRENGQHGRKRLVGIGTFDTAVEAAHAYAVHMTAS